MALVDILANPGTPFQTSFLRAEQNRRADETHGLQQRMGEFNLQQAQQKQTDNESRKRRIMEYGGDSQELVKQHLMVGDSDAAENTIKRDQMLSQLGTAQRKEAEGKQARLMKDTNDTSRAVLETFKGRDGIQQGMNQSIQEVERIKRQFPELAKQMPDVRSMHPDQVQQFWQQKYDRSLKNLEFDEKKRHALETEKAAMARAERVTGGTGSQRVSKTYLPDGTVNLYNPKGDYVGKQLGADGKPVKSFRSEKEKAIDNRANTRAKLAKDKFGFTVSKERTRATKVMRDDWGKDVKSLRAMDVEISRVIAAAKGGGPLAHKNIQSALSRMSNAKVRALAELQQYRNFGTLPQRVSNAVSLFFRGHYSEISNQQAHDFVVALRENWVKPGMNELNIFWRQQAKTEKLNPHSVARYRSVDELKADYKKGFLTRDQAALIIDDNPQWGERK